MICFNQYQSYIIYIERGNIIIADKNYTELLNDLKDNKIKELVVKPDEFTEFQVAYMNFDTRKRVIGKADQNGVITYTYLSDSGTNS